MAFNRNTTIDSLLIGLLAFAPLALASVHTWAYCTMAICALILFDLNFLKDITALKKVFSIPISIALAFFLLVTLFYTIPLPVQLIKIFSPAAVKLREAYMLNESFFQPLSLYSRATLIYIIKLFSYLMVFLVIVSKITGKRKIMNSEEKDIQENHNTGSTYSVYIMFGALTSVLSLLFHSICDFNLNIPANALYFTVYLAIIAGISNSRGHCNEKFLKKLVGSIIIIGFMIAVFAIVQKLSSNGKIYWMIKVAGSYCGPFINYDHFAGFMEMCTFMAIANFIASISSSSFVYMKKFKDKIIWFSTREANKMLIHLFFAVVMTTALFLSTSRGGIMSFCAALSVFYFGSIICAEKKKRIRILSASIMVVVLISIMALWIGPEETVDRFKVLDKIVRFFIKEKAILSELRPYFWKDTLEMIKDYPLTGTGLGTYSYVFQKYRTFSSSWGFLRYAHNDYLQFLAEMGLLGGGFIIGFFIWYFRRFRECLRRLKKLG